MGEGVTKNCSSLRDVIYGRPLGESDELDAHAGGEGDELDADDRRIDFQREEELQDDVATSEMRQVSILLIIYDQLFSGHSNNTSFFKRLFFLKVKWLP